MKLTSWIFLTLLMFQQSVLARNVTLVGTLEQPLPVSPTPHALFFNKKPASITLLKWKLSSRAQQRVHQKITQALHASSSVDATPQTLSSIQLGMNNVPVLNQGNHGTCVTFAATAAIDAVLDKGDYISQLCQLQLGSYLENNTYQSSGWEGSWGRSVLSQLEVFGFVSKTQQRANACGSLSEYPLIAPKSSEELPLVTYHPLSESMTLNSVAWSAVLDDYGIMLDNPSPNQILHTIKQILNAGDRLTIGVLLLNFDQGTIGALGTFHTTHDTWVLTPEMENSIDDKTEFAGHEMILTGYDDNAVATDEQGKTYYGLFTLRNSWGPQIGDHGNFYMTYDYLKTLIIEAQRIRSLKKSALTNDQTFAD